MIANSLLFFLQKEMFASKMPDGSSGGGGIPPPVVAPAHPGGAFRAEPAPPRAHRDPNQDFQEPPRERKVSESSGGPAGKSKWMSAFKSIKGKKDPEEDR